MVITLEPYCPLASRLFDSSFKYGLFEAVAWHGGQSLSKATTLENLCNAKLSANYRDSIIFTIAQP